MKERKKRKKEKNEKQKGQHINNNNNKFIYLIQLNYDHFNTVQKKMSRIDTFIDDQKSIFS